MTDYYGKMSALGICVDAWIASGMYVRGTLESNDLGIALELVKEMPKAVQQVGYYAYTLRNKGASYVQEQS